MKRKREEYWNPEGEKTFWQHILTNQSMAWTAQLFSTFSHSANAGLVGKVDGVCTWSLLWEISPGKALCILTACFWIRKAGFIESWNCGGWKRPPRSSCQTIDPSHYAHWTHPSLPHLHGFWTPPGMVTLPLPWAACSNAFPLFLRRHFFLLSDLRGATGRTNTWENSL